ncbi:L,D-transpeptidase family protein [Roseococcus sp.]|uniref:L,D-transpeptidase family protein n=1 Tax=Roseococcus sp. TaxID=2109646 RepID=UPI003BABD61C
MDRRQFLSGVAALAAPVASARAQGGGAAARTMVASSEAMRRLAERLARIEEDGLDPRWYGLTPQSLQDPATIARSTGLVLTDLVQGRVASIPGRMDLLRENNAAALNNWMQEVATSAEPAEVLDRASAPTPELATLKAGLAAARARAVTGWPGFPTGGRVLEPGATDEVRVNALRARLVVTDPELAANPGTGPVYDEVLQAAVRRFQAAVGTEADARVGATSMTALNRSPQSIVNQIRVAMDMRRGAPARPRDRRVEVNIPDYRLKVFDEGRVIMDMAVVVGGVVRQTPMIQARLTAVQFNPPWGVPARNAKEDVLPRLRRDPSAVAAKGFRIFQRVDGEVVEVDPTTVDWRAVNPDRFPYIIRQDAGDSSALGRLKFIMPNGDDIYMHDTPDRHYFRLADRARSSGCIRLDRPMDFLMLLLDGMPGWDRARAERTVAGRVTSVNAVRRQLPVRLHYNTVTVDGAEMRIRQDIYGLDAAYARAMDARTRTTGVPMAAAAL